MTKEQAEQFERFGTVPPDSSERDVRTVLSSDEFSPSGASTYTATVVATPAQLAKASKALRELGIHGTWHKVGGDDYGRR